MTIPIWTTTVSVLRPTVQDGDADGYPDSTPVYNKVSSGTHAVIMSATRGVSGGGSKTVREGSERVINVFKLVADPVSVQNTDQILDETTQQLYRVEWIAPRPGYGLDHVDVGLSFVEGFNP